MPDALNVPLVIGMSPSTSSTVPKRAFATQAETTRELARMIVGPAGDVAELTDWVTPINLDELRTAAGRAVLDAVAARETLQQLHERGELDERVVLLLGAAVAGTFARWFGTTTIARNTVVPLTHADGWGCTVVAIDHPGRHRYWSAARKAMLSTLMKDMLAFEPAPSRRERAEDFRRDIAERRILIEADIARMNADYDAEEAAEMADEWAREMQAQVGYHDTPTCFPDEDDIDDPQERYARRV